MDFVSIFNWGLNCSLPTGTGYHWPLAKDLHLASPFPGLSQRLDGSCRDRRLQSAPGVPAAILSFEAWQLGQYETIMIMVDNG
jgi:hypothetical protein